MSLTTRKPRPIIARDRDPHSLRDDRLFIVGCDDTYAPAQYFGFFKLARVKVFVVPTVDGTSVPKYVLDRLLQYEHEQDDELWMVLDTDHLIRGPHLAGLTQTMQEAKRQGVNIALSRPCFEVFLLLHHEGEETVAGLGSAAEICASLAARIGGYNKANLKRSAFPLSTVASACQRAERLDSTAGGEIPTQNTSRVYLLWKAIVAKALSSQLPPELHALVPMEDLLTS